MCHLEPASSDDLLEAGRLNLYHINDNIVYKLISAFRASGRFFVNFAVVVVVRAAF